MANKKAVFLVERNLCYKFFSPLIERLLNIGIEVHLIHYASSSLLSTSSGKLFYYPQLNQIPQFSKPITHIHRVINQQNLNQCILNNNFDYIFSLHPKSFYPGLKTSAKWTTVQHGVDSTKYKDQTADYYIIYSKNWFKNIDVLSKSKVFEAGLYYSEKKLTDRKSIIERYNLSSDKKYVLFIPLPTSDHRAYSFWPYKKLNYFVIKYLIDKEIEILKSLKQSFDKTNTEILIKSRFKRFLPAVYHELANVFYDDLFYPCSTIDLVSVAEHVYINYMPGAIFTEIAAFQKPYTYIHFPKLDKHTFEHISGRMREAFLPDESQSNWVHHSKRDELANYNLRKGHPSPNYTESYVLPKNMLSLDDILKEIL